MTEAPQPRATKDTSVCGQCKFREDKKWNKCPKCSSTRVRSTTMSHFPGGQMSRGHIAGAQTFDGPFNDPEPYTG